ncbi:MAG: hypothetical protein RJA70_1863 [Pseudomonadota bacterium]|jgi:uncharacterized protein YajQ (UPF0234 family)
MPTFDIVSKLDWSEVSNAHNQAERELGQRFDFKGTSAKIEKTEAGFLITASTDDRVKAAYDVLQEKLVKRKVSLKHFEADKPVPGPRANSKMTVSVAEGINPDKAREITKRVKESKLKAQAAIQDDTVRISAKQRDDLQAVIADLKAQDFGIELQFKNFRD